MQFSMQFLYTIYNNLPLKYTLSWQVLILIVLLSRSSDLMNCNGKRMKPEATCLTEAQRCEIVAKLSKPNAPSKWALGREYEVNEGTIRKVWDNWENILQRIICCESLSRHLPNRKVLLTSKTLKLYTTLSLTSTTNCFSSMFKRKLNRCMMNSDNRLRRFNESLTN